MSALRAAQPAPSCSEHELISAVRYGDDRAFEELYARYRPRIGSYVFGMVGDHQRAEDIAQEVFIAALRRLRATERPIAFKPWIYEIAKNACIDEFRRARRTREVPLETDADDAEASPDRHRRPTAPTLRSSTSSGSTTCAGPSTDCRTATTGSSSCASSRAARTTRSASAWG